MLIFFSVRGKNCPLNLKKEVFFNRKDAEKLTIFCSKRNHLVTFDILEIEFVASKKQGFTKEELSAIQRLLASDRMSTVLRIKMNLGNQKDFSMNFGKGNFRDLCSLELYHMTAVNFEYLIPFITQDLTLVGLNLVNIPKHLSSQLSYLDLSENDFSKVNQLNFEKHRNLVYLFLSNCRLTQSPVLPDGDNLVSLDLSHNCYTMMPSQFIPDSVEDLFIENNQLLKYPLMPLHLMNVQLGNNMCNRLPENLTQCKSLQSIDHQHISVFFSYAEKMFIDNVLRNMVDPLSALLTAHNPNITNMTLTAWIPNIQFVESQGVSDQHLNIQSLERHSQQNEMETEHESDALDRMVPTAPIIQQREQREQHEQREQQDNLPVYWNFQISEF